MIENGQNALRGGRWDTRLGSRVSRLSPSVRRRRGAGDGSAARLEAQPAKPEAAPAVNYQQEPLQVKQGGAEDPFGSAHLFQGKAIGVCARGIVAESSHTDHDADGFSHFIAFRLDARNLHSLTVFLENP